MMREELIEAMARGMREAELSDGEGSTYRLFDLLDFSGENKSRTITREVAQAALTAHDEWLKANGLVIVPVKPTQEMTNASWKFASGQSVVAQCEDHTKQCEAYRIMIEAAP